MLCLLDQNSNSFKIVSAVSTISTQGKSVFMKFGTELDFLII